MKNYISLILLVGWFFWSPIHAAEPLRLFLRGGPKTHGPAGNGLHEHERWLMDWTALLRERGAHVEAGMEFPTADQLAKVDVLVMFAANAGSITGPSRTALEQFLKRGGGIVCFHDAVCGDDAGWFKTVVGGAWEHGHSKYYEGEISLYYVNHTHPITDNASNFDITDELYWDLRMEPGATVLAASWQPDARRTSDGRPRPHIYEVVPQVWVYETSSHRAFVCLLGHRYETFQMTHVRAMMLRGIAWAGRREAHTLCSRAELASYRYPEGGPVAPELAHGPLELHPEFSLQLIAAEPLISKPMAIDWDPTGRLWVAETPEYPNGRRGLREDMKGEEWKDHGGLVAQSGIVERPAKDRISSVEDTDGDGLMDRKAVFFEGLELVTSFAFYRGGIIASAAPDIWEIRDRDRDGKADLVEKLYTGLGTRDTHAVINNLRWGMDGWIYATHGYSAGDVTSADGSRRFGSIGSGVVRFKADGSGFEQYASKVGNTWGLDIAWDNEVFFTQPTSGDLLNHVVLPESVLARARIGNTASFHPLIRRRPSVPLINYQSLAYVQIDQVGYFTASAGCAIYDSGTWPSEWRYSYFTTEPTINLIHHEAVEPDGVTFAARKTREAEFLAGRDMWFRPIETRIGPDGALYLLDFYNQAVIHNDTRGPRHNMVNAAVRPDRDHYFGRIWKIDHRKARQVPVPDLAQAKPEALCLALKHPNRAVRMSAFRLLAEAEHGGEVLHAPLEKLARSTDHPETQVLSLWLLYHMNAMPPGLLTASMRGEQVAVRKNALRIAQKTPSKPVRPDTQALLEALRDDHSRVRLEAWVALAETAIDEDEALAVVSAYTSLQDPWLKSAALATMASSPLLYLQALFQSSDLASVAGLAKDLIRLTARHENVDSVARTLRIIASQPSEKDPLKAVALETLAREVSNDFRPSWNEELQTAFSALLQSSNHSIQVAALPLAAKWDAHRTLTHDFDSLIVRLVEELKRPMRDSDDRLSLVNSLLGVSPRNNQIVPATAALLIGDQPESFKREVLLALGATATPEVGAQLTAIYTQLLPDLQDQLIGQVLKRADWSLKFLAAVESGAIPHDALRLSTVHRLRQHSDLEVARTANELMDQLRGPEWLEKNTLIAQLTPAVQRGGDASLGRLLFEQNCSACHLFDGQGREVGPGLNGMGAHGAAELLVHIVDPNRAVEDTYLAVSIETNQEEIYDGIVARENQSSVFIRNSSGESEIAKKDIRHRRSTGQSLMPSGFEALGEVGLCHLLAYMTSTECRYRFLDLSKAFTADTRRGLYQTVSDVNDSLKFKKFGPVVVEGVPFNVVDPARNPGGRNVVALKGGPNAEAFSKSYPQRVEIRVDLSVSRFHVLGGIGGWGYPWGGEPTKSLPAMRITVYNLNGQTEEIVLQNGVEFADWAREIEVPGSKLASGVLTANQVRWLTVPLRQPGHVEKVVLESFDNHLAPTTVAITAELIPEAGSTRPELVEYAQGEAYNEIVAAGVAEEVSATGEVESKKPIRVLIVGGGSSHDFDQWFNKADVATLKLEGLANATYTDQPEEIVPLLPSLDVLYLSLNQPIPNETVRQGIFQFADQRKGLLLVHAAVWLNWKDWPEYNRVLAGGSSRGHDRLGEFEVKLTDVKHPVTEGVAAAFTIRDELYWFEPEPQGTPIQVLAAAHSPQRDKTYPMVWIVKHPKARIACIALGHDGAAHNHQDYQRLLRNALRWAAGG